MILYTHYTHLEITMLRFVDYKQMNICDASPSNASPSGAL
jgi:hypothetical protein